LHLIYRVSDRLVNHRESSQTNSPPLPVLPLVRPAGVFGPGTLIPLYVLMIVIGYLLFHSGAATVRGNELSRQQSLFTAVNAATLSGFRQAKNVNDYTPFGQILAFCLTLGGILFSFIAGGLAVVRIARMRYSDRQIFAWACGVTALVALLGGLLLLLIGRDLGPFDAVFQAVSAFGNSGLYAGPLPDGNSLPAHLLLMPLAVLGGLGLPVLMELADRVRGKSDFSQHSQTVLNWTAGCYLVALVVLLLLQFPSQPSSGDAWREAALSASREAINSRSAGFPFALAVNPLVQWIIIGLMVIGAAPAGTAGGIKVTTIAVLSRGTRRALDGQSPGRSFGVALVWTASYLAMLAAALLVLLWTEPDIRPDKLLFLAASALGNVGLSPDPVAVSDASLYALSVIMLAGRIAPILILWWMADTTPDALVAVG
jgi:Trk-type K+ transport system membrane component